jgi:hypothetical protein
MKWIGKHPVFSDLLIGGVLLTPPDNQYSYELTLPNDDGTSGQVLSTDGNGILSWVANGVAVPNALTAGTGIDYNTGTTWDGSVAKTISVDVSDFMTNGLDNRIVTATGTDAMNAEADLTFDSETLTIGADDDGEAIIRRTVHSDDDGGDLIIRGGNATGTDKSGGKLKLQAGLGTGAGQTSTGGDIEFYTAWPGSSGAGQQSGHAYPMFEFQSPTSSRNDFIIYQPGTSQNDYFTIRTATHAPTTIKTIDSAGSNADLSIQVDGDLDLDVDGNIEINADGGTITFKDGSTTFGTIDSSSVFIKETKVTIDQAGCNALNSSPQTLVAAQGANKIIIPVEVTCLVDNDTTADTSLGDLIVGWNNTTTFTYALKYARRWMYGITTDMTFVLSTYAGKGAASLTGGENVPLTISTSTGMTNNSLTSMTVYTSYYVIDNS